VATGTDAAHDPRFIAACPDVELAANHHEQAIGGIALAPDDLTLRVEHLLEASGQLLELGSLEGAQERHARQ
jgi:hypothetical protein